MVIFLFYLPPYSNYSDVHCCIPYRDPLWVLDILRMAPEGRVPGTNVCDIERCTCSPVSVAARHAHVTSSTFLDKAACLQLSCGVRQAFVGL